MTPVSVCSTSVNINSLDFLPPNCQQTRLTGITINHNRTAAAAAAAAAAAVAALAAAAEATTTTNIYLNSRCYRVKE